MTERKYTVAAIGPRIDAFLRQTLQSGGFRLKYDMEDSQTSDDDFETPDILVKFTGSDVDLLLANRAEMLLALEHVTMEMLRMPSEDHSRISFDANDYRLLRIEELRLSAQAAGEKVKRTGVPFRFNPMNSRERRVIHLALRNETSLRSESGGAGPGRHVVVYPAGMASLPAPPYVPEPRGGFGNAPRSGFGSGPRHGDGPPRRSAGGAPRHGDGPPRGPRRRS